MAFIARNLTPKIGTEVEAGRASLLNGEHGAAIPRSPTSTPPTTHSPRQKNATTAR
jgi:hypothetical protein